MATRLQEFTAKLMAGQDLTAGEAEEALELILAEETADAAIASFLTALAIKGETPEEIAGFARVMRQHAVPVRSSHPKLIDTAGTGGGADTFNISTAAAFVIAGAGVAVAKHGNRAITSRCGSADVLAALGVRIDCPVETTEQALNEIGLAFMFAPLFHPAMKRVAGIRRQLGHRTVFNLLGPLTNPAGAHYQIIGVFAPELAEKLAQALTTLDCRRAWVVHSLDGLDELSTASRARVCEMHEGQVRAFDLDPKDFGFKKSAGTGMTGGTPEENAELIRGLLESRMRGAARDVVLLNAGAALHVAGEGELERALKKAEESLASGAALEKLEQLKRVYAIS